MGSEQKQSDNVIFHGACLCNQVTYTIRGHPLSMCICHCNNCQRASGSAFGSNFYCHKDQFQVLTGQNQLKEYQDRGGEAEGRVMRAFCGTCGSRLYLTSPDNPLLKDNIVVTIGTLDEAARRMFMPKQEFFVKRRHGWYRIEEQTVEFRENIQA